MMANSDDVRTGEFPAIPIAATGASRGKGPSGRPNARRSTRSSAPRAATKIISSVVVIVLCAALGFAFVVQQHSVQTNYSTLSENELVRLLDETNRQITQLEAQKSTLAGQLTSIQQSADKQRQIQQVAKANEEASGILSGRLPAHGKGIVITIRSSQHITGATLFNLIEELRNAGAEVIQFNDVRVVTSTSIVDTKAGVSCDGHALASPYTFRAIGDPQALANAISIAGGVGSALRVQYKAKVTIAKDDDVIISAVVPVKKYSYATVVAQQ